jgi:hypothetical protein
MDFFPTAAAAAAELTASGATLLLDAEELTLEDLAEKDFCFAIPFLLQAWFTLIPLGCRAPEIHFADLEKSYEHNLRQFEACGQAKTPKKLKEFFLSSPQPGLMLVLLGSFFEAANIAPAEIRPSPDAQPFMLALLKATVETLDEALRST